VTRRRLGASLAQRVNEVLAIRIIHDDQFAPVTIIHDVRQQTRLSICGPCQESGFGRYTYQHQELTPLTDPFNNLDAACDDRFRNWSWTRQLSESLEHLSRDNRLVRLWTR